MTIINNNNGEYSNNAGYIVNQYLSEKLIEQYEERILELKDLIKKFKRRKFYVKKIAFSFLNFRSLGNNKSEN